MSSIRPLLLLLNKTMLKVYHTNLKPNKLLLYARQFFALSTINRVKKKVKHQGESQELPDQKSLFSAKLMSADDENIMYICYE